MTCSTKSIREKHNLKSYTKCDIVYDSSKGAFPQHHMVHSCMQPITTKKKKKRFFWWSTVDVHIALYLNSGPTWFACPAYQMVMSMVHLFQRLGWKTFFELSFLGHWDQVKSKLLYTPLWITVCLIVCNCYSFFLWQLNHRNQTLKCFFIFFLNLFMIRKGYGNWFVFLYKRKKI